MSRKQFIGLILGCSLPLALFLCPAFGPTEVRMALAVSLFAILFWTFEPAPIEYTSLVVLVLFPLLKVLPFEMSFGPFSGRAVWLVFAGMALSLGITETPLGSRFAGIVLSRAGTYNRLILGLHVLGVVMALLVPSGVVRVLILMPVLISLLKSLGESPASPVSAALVLSVVCATYYSGTGVLTASVPNMVVLGVMESRGSPIYWGQWAFYLFPVIGLARVGVGYLLVRLLHPVGSSPVLAATPEGAPHAPTRAEKKVLAILLLGILLWSTDTFHGIHPTYIGLVLVLLCYLPGWGPLPPGLLRKVNFPLLIFIAAAFDIGTALEYTGFSRTLASGLTELIDLSGVPDPLKLGIITALVVPFDFLMDTAAVAAAITPVLLDFGVRFGLEPLPVALSVGIGTGMVFIPYQGAPFVVAYGFRYVRMGQFILLMSLISLLTLVLLLPLNMVFWRLIGFI